MYDEDINSNCDSEQSVYAQFMQWLKENFGAGEDGKSFRDRLGDNLEDMLDDYLEQK